jgi:hypothetical protein
MWYDGIKPFNEPKPAMKEEINLEIPGTGYWYTKSLLKKNINQLNLIDFSLSIIIL